MALAPLPPGFTRDHPKVKQRNWEVRRPASSQTLLGYLYCEAVRPGKHNTQPLLYCRCELCGRHIFLKANNFYRQQACGCMRTRKGQQRFDNSFLKDETRISLAREVGGVALQVIGIPMRRGFV